MPEDCRIRIKTGCITCSLTHAALGINMMKNRYADTCRESGIMEKWWGGSHG